MSYKDLTVILPTLNEEGNIKPLISKLMDVLPGVHILVVDDNSSDKTALIAQAMSEEDSAVSLIVRKGKACLTKSIEIGVKASKTDYVAWMDADFSHPPEVLSQLYTLAKKYGCSIATRWVKDDTSKTSSGAQNDTVLSAALSAFLNFCVYHILRLKITDYTSGFIVCRSELIKNHDFVGDYGEYFIELMYYLDRIGIKVQELPYNSPPRHSGYSKTGTNIIKLSRRGIKYIIMIIRILLPKRLFGRFSFAIKRTTLGSLTDDQTSLK